jgi:DNA-binding LacI/PurR family transcriptional regulator
MATIYDVAKRAGVSISTVSRVLNNNPNVLHDTRQRVLKVIADMNFKPNPIARGLVVKQTNILEVFFSWTGYRLSFDNTWYMGILNGVNEVVRQNKYDLLINTVAGDYDVRALCEKAFNNIVDGVLVVSPYLSEPDVKKMADERLPFVLVSYRVEDPRLDYVDSDNEAAAAMVVDHLAGLGRRKISVINGNIDSSRNAQDRWEGFKKGLQKHGIALPDSYVTQGVFSTESGEACAEKLLNLPDPPDAIFAANDAMAMGVVNIMKKRNLTPGKEVAVVGFDDIDEASNPYYELTTVKQDIFTISAEATTLLIQKVRQQQQNLPWVSQHRIIPTQLVVRKSCGSKN